MEPGFTIVLVCINVISKYEQKRLNPYSKFLTLSSKETIFERVTMSLQGWKGFTLYFLLKTKNSLNEFFQQKKLIPKSAL